MKPWTIILLVGAISSMLCALNAIFAPASDAASAPISCFILIGLLFALIKLWGGDFSIVYKLSVWGVVVCVFSLALVGLFRYRNMAEKRAVLREEKLNELKEIWRKSNTQERK